MVLRIAQKTNLGDLEYIRMGSYTQESIQKHFVSKFDGVNIEVPYCVFGFDETEQGEVKFFLEIDFFYKNVLGLSYDNEKFFDLLDGISTSVFSDITEYLTLETNFDFFNSEM